jgi:hypothetical protein
LATLNSGSFAKDNNLGTCGAHIFFGGTIWNAGRIRFAVTATSSGNARYDLGQLRIGTSWSKNGVWSLRQTIK